MSREIKKYKNEYCIDGGRYIVERSFGSTKTVGDLIKEIITTKELASHTCCKGESVI